MSEPNHLVLFSHELKNLLSYYIKYIASNKKEENDSIYLELERIFTNSKEALTLINSLSELIISNKSNLLDETVVAKLDSI